ncbi:MAG: chemotaxis protein CheW [Pseudomonadota bacterium]
MSTVEKRAENAPAHDGQFLSFTLGGEHYGVDILRVQEIKGWEEVRPLPDTPEFIKGVLDLRGVIVPIIDLRSRFNFASVEYTPTTVTIVLSVERAGKPLIIGVVVDGVSDVLNVKCAEVRKAPDLGTHINTQYITGMFTQNERMIVLLDADRLFNPDELGLPERIT